MPAYSHTYQLTSFPGRRHGIQAVFRTIPESQILWEVLSTVTSQKYNSCAIKESKMLGQMWRWYIHQCMGWELTVQDGPSRHSTSRTLHQLLNRCVAVPHKHGCHTWWMFSVCASLLDRSRPRIQNSAIPQSRGGKSCSCEPLIFPMDTVEPLWSGHWLRVFIGKMSWVEEKFKAVLCVPWCPSIWCPN